MSMSDTLHIATRKGLFRFQRQESDWTAGPPAFPGEPVTAVLADARDGVLYAALRPGHFGVKFHRSEDGGESWNGLPAPQFHHPGGKPAEAPSLAMNWKLAPGRAAPPGPPWA